MAELGGPPAKALEQVSSLDPPLEGGESSGGGLVQGGEGAEGLTLGPADQGLGEAAIHSFTDPTTRSRSSSDP